MTALYLIGGVVSLGLMVYLVIALLKPEIFSLLPTESSSCCSTSSF